MDSKDIRLIRHCLPETMAFPYYSDREIAWLLAQHMDSDTPTRSIKALPSAKLLERPMIKPLTAAGGGVLRHGDVLALADAGQALERSDLGPAAHKALCRTWCEPWLDFELSLGSWGTDDDWQWDQLSRKGGNLVLQLGFPSEHAELMRRYMRSETRKSFEAPWHPIRRDGRPTLAWARLDVDLNTGTALIEEVQSDWLRIVQRRVAHMVHSDVRGRDLRNAMIYQLRLRQQYERLWPRAMLLATLVFLRGELGCRDIFMHMPATGAMLKHITDDLPPRSLYSTLPKSFCFVKTRTAPHFLQKPCGRYLRRLGIGGKPVFWHLQLNSG